MLKSMITSILLFSMTSASIAMADVSQCLSQANNQELIRELSSRLQNGSAGPISSKGGFVIAFVCGGNAEVLITSTDLSTGISKNGSISTGSWDTCRSMASQLNSKIGNVTLYTGKIVAVCGGNAEVLRTLINETSVKTISSISTGSWDSCRKQADELNQNLTK